MSKASHRGCRQSDERTAGHSAGECGGIDDLGGRPGVGTERDRATAAGVGGAVAAGTANRDPVGHCDRPGRRRCAAGSQPVRRDRGSDRCLGAGRSADQPADSSSHRPCRKADAGPIEPTADSREPAAPKACHAGIVRPHGNGNGTGDRCGYTVRDGDRGKRARIAGRRSRSAQRPGIVRPDHRTFADLVAAAGAIAFRPGCERHCPTRSDAADSTSSATTGGARRFAATGQHRPRCADPAVPAVGPGRGAGGRSIAVRRDRRLDNASRREWWTPGTGYAAATRPIGDGDTVIDPVRRPDRDRGRTAALPRPRTAGTPGPGRHTAIGHRRNPAASSRGRHRRRTGAHHRGCHRRRAHRRDDGTGPCIIAGQRP